MARRYAVYCRISPKEGLQSSLNPVRGRKKLPVKKRLLDRTRQVSERQQRVIELVAQGLKNREIATELGIGPHVVRNCLSAIRDKVGVSNRVELALWYEARRHEGRIRRAA